MSQLQRVFLVVLSVAVVLVAATAAPAISFFTLDNQAPGLNWSTDQAAVWFGGSKPGVSDNPLMGINNGFGSNSGTLPDIIGNTTETYGETNIGSGAKLTLTSGANFTSTIGIIGEHSRPQTNGSGWNGEIHQEAGTEFHVQDMIWGRAQRFYMTISGGLFDNYDGTQNNVMGVDGGQGLVDQSGGVAKIAGEFNMGVDTDNGWLVFGSTVNKSAWNLSGGELALLMGFDSFESSAADGVVISGSGALYVPNANYNTYGELTMGGRVSGATVANQGNWVLGDGTQLNDYTRLATAPIPEPSSLVLAGLGLLGLCGWGVRRRTKK